jgi:hypothetical protein
VCAVVVIAINLWIVCATFFGEPESVRSWLARTSCGAVNVARRVTRIIRGELNIN